MKCPFCPENVENKVYEGKVLFAIEDKNPVSNGHLLIIPKRHCKTFFDLTNEELIEAFKILKEMKENILKEDSSVTGFNVGMNSGESAGQTVFHCHIHLIPRRDGDTPNPRGGVRGVIPHKMSY